MLPPFCLYVFVLWTSSCFLTAFADPTTKVPDGGALHVEKYLDGLSKNQRQLFEYGMTGLDSNFRKPFLFGSPRYSSWYAVGLLARNRDSDVKTASQIIRNVIKQQYKDPNKLWFGTFKNAPTAPDPGDVYPPQPYGSYDLNQGLFVCTSWIIAMEEFQPLLEPALVKLMKESMYNATVGDSYRVGGVDGDNLRPVYSNPWYMRVMAATYVGHMASDANMTYWGNEWARQAIAEFDRYGTLSEFNTGTYTGVSLYALSLWGYMPKGSAIARRAPDIITQTWKAIGALWNPSLKTLGGPWDRSYGFSLKDYLGILGVQITGLVGGLDDDTAPLPLPLVGSAHYGDGTIIALTPLTAKFHDPYVPKAVLSQLTQFNNSQGRSYQTQAVSPPFDSLSVPRNYTSWNEPGLSVGGMQIDSNVVGGAAINPGQHVPAVILWETGEGETGWISHYSTSRTISSVASSTNLTVSYPPSQAFPELSEGTSSIMTFLISGISGLTLPSNFLSAETNYSYNLPGLKLKISGNVPTAGDTLRSFNYGIGTLNDLKYYNLTYIIPDELVGVPTIVLEFKRG